MHLPVIKAVCFDRYSSHPSMCTNSECGERDIYLEAG